jgi:5-methylcytosine-specific restriction protein A
VSPFFIVKDDMPQAAKRFKGGSRRSDSFLPCRKYHKLYTSTVWLRLRESFLRDNPLCIECKREGRHILATVVDHIIPHKGNKDIFYDASGLQSLCKRHHDKKTYRENRAHGNS